MLENKYQFFKLGMSFWILIFACLPVRQGFWIFSSFAKSEFTYDEQGKRNPFIPLVTPDGKLLELEREKTTGDVTLEGIIYDGSGVSYAIVNSKVVKVGDTINGYQVLRIEKDKVIFIKGGKPIEVKLKKEEK